MTELKGWGEKIADKYTKMLNEGLLDNKVDSRSQQLEKVREQNILRFGSGIMHLADARSKIDTAGKFLEGGSKNDAELALKAALVDINEALKEIEEK